MSELQRAGKETSEFIDLYIETMETQFKAAIAGFTTAVAVTVVWLLWFTC